MYTDRLGFPVYRCTRGTNTIEGGVHQNIVRKFASFNASPALTDCALADYRLRHNIQLNDIQADHRYDIRFMEGFHTIFPATDTRESCNARHSNTFERMHSLMHAEALGADDPDFLPFNERQALVYNTIRDAALEGNPVFGPRIYFVNGPCGTGKTFVLNALLVRFRIKGEVAIAVASGGTASLLLKGGRTAHYMFQIPLDVTTTTMCKMTPRSEIATHGEQKLD
ncbi:hypothetical protein [Parasitella parasitica]|uniref:ATP-dependent DNA helicase n=1 Tax=Parasitella parasitica TaxID=35722 RepID=A0A0B7MTX4_9FUNG|nr:hypothetical protein [Parasitella parasitica]